MTDRVVSPWAVRNLLAGSVSTAVDLAALIFLVERAHLAPVPATALAVVAGGIVSFFLNKYVAIREFEADVGSQISRFAAGVGISLLLHAALVFTLTQRFGLHYVTAKLLADGLIFTLSQPLLVRYVVFPERRLAHAGRALACVSMAAALSGGPVLPSRFSDPATLLSAQNQHDVGDSRFERLDALDQLQLASRGFLLESPPASARPLAFPDVLKPSTAPTPDPLRRPPKA